jgi:hypothetical protein
MNNEAHSRRRGGVLGRWPLASSARQVPRHPPVSVVHFQWVALRRSIARASPSYVWCGKRERDYQRQGELRFVGKHRGRAFRQTSAQQRTPPKGTRSFGSLFRRVVRKDTGSVPQRLTRSGIRGGMTVAGRRKDTAVRDWVDACIGGRRSPSADAGVAWPSPGSSSASPSVGLPPGCGGRR